jgi:hypothetical protein
MKSLRVKLAAGVAVLGVAGIGTAAVAHDRSRLATFLNGYEEVPAISTDANGVFKASISRNRDEIEYTLVYYGPFNPPVPPSTIPAAVTQSHIHVGQRSVSGGISAWLCQTAAAPAPAASAPVPMCPPPGTPVSGTLTPGHVIGPATQGIQAGEFNELVRALRAGVAYANVHTTTHPGGEIRGQISDDDRGRDRD